MDRITTQSILELLNDPRVDPAQRGIPKRLLNKALNNVEIMSKMCNDPRLTEFFNTPDCYSVLITGTKLYLKQSVIKLLNKNSKPDEEMLTKLIKEFVRYKQSVVLPILINNDDTITTKQFYVICRYPNWNKLIDTIVTEKKYILTDTQYKQLKKSFTAGGGRDASVKKFFDKLSE